MKSLEGFSMSENGEVSLCEVDGRLHSMKYEYANIAAFTNSIDRHPKIHITRDLLHSLTSGDEGRALFLPVREPFFKQVAKRWYEQGFTEALSLIASEKRNSSPVMVLLAQWTLKMTDILSSVHNVFQPYMLQDRRKLIASFSQTRNWLNGPIRCVAWHPHCTKIAVAASDDSVRIYSTDSNLVPVLKSKLQRSVSCIAWRPLSASEIAVACESCILIWTVDPNSVVTRPSTANSYVLRRVNHWPVTSVAWSPHGEYLVSASPADPALLVWDVALDQTCSLRRAGPAGNTLLSWAPGNGTQLVAATSSLVFRVWDCKNWSAERWTTVSDRIQTACWSPCGRILLFATYDESVIYALNFEISNASTSVFNASVAGASPQVACVVLDLARTEISDRGELIGGLIQAIDWDPKGRHLAVLFKETNFVAIFMTIYKPTLQITPSCLVSGMLGEYPCTMAFQKNFAEGSCLSIGWSSGRLQHFPLIYSDATVQTSPVRSIYVESFDNSYSSYANM